MGVYDIKIKRLTLLLLPTALRKPLVAALMQSAVQGCNAIYGSFMRWRGDKGYRLEHNGQVCRLRAILNDTFDIGPRRITIDDDESESLLGTLIYTRETGRHLLLPMTDTGIIINRRGYSGASDIGFWVTVPRELLRTIDENMLSAIVNTYRLASTRWVINEI